MMNAAGGCGADGVFAQMGNIIHVFIFFRNRFTSSNTTQADRTIWGNAREQYYKFISFQVK